MSEGNGAAQRPDDGKVEVTIDGRQLRVARGTLLWDACTQAGVHVPVYCAHPKMDPVAVCRMCLVTIEKMPKLQPACASVVSDGMVVHTQTDQVAKTREGVLEFLLVNHPLDCPVCDRGGECDLQDFAYRYGPETSRFPITDKVHFEKAVPLSEKIELDNERCILCWRCVRYYDEITGEKEIVLVERGVHTAVGTFEGRELTSDFQGNLPEVCPVGALTHRQYRFKARPWDLQRAKSVCPECAYGCNISVDTRDFEVVRFASRDNPLVDDMWLCDRGRYSATAWNDVTRVRRPMLRSRTGEVHDVAVTEAVREAASLLARARDQHGSGAIGALASPDCLNEELWSFQRLAREVLGTPHLDHQLQSFDGLSPEEHELGIAETEGCAAVVVLGGEPERNAPVLTLRLYKAERKHGARVLRVDADETAGTVAALVGDASSPKTVGVVVDESNRARGAAVARELRRAGHPVKRLTITRGVNGRGAKDLGVLPNLRPGYEPAGEPTGMSGRQILEATAAGRIRALLLLDGDAVIRDGGELAARALRTAEVVVAIETRPGAVSDSATVVIPGHTFLEKQGSVTNIEGRVQRVRPAVPAATHVPSETRLIAMLAAELGEEGWPADALQVNRQMLAAIPAYREAGNGGRARFGVAVA